jgi:cytochrome P450
VGHALDHDDAVATTQKYDLYGEEFRANRFDVYARMREQDPVLLQPGIDGETPIWFLTRYEDVVAVLMDDERFVRDPALVLNDEELAQIRAGLPDDFAFIENHMLNKDGADHRRLRRLVTKAFTPRMVEQLRPRIQAIADELVDAVEERREMELVEEFAFPLPITVIAELLGIPVADQKRFREWSDAVVRPSISPSELERFAGQMRDFVAYLRELFERRRREPADDLISALLQAEEAGDSLSEAELFSTVILLIVAGHETTVSLIGSAVLALLGDPSALERLRAEPELIPGAVEELLRREAAVDRTLVRWATADAELGGRTIKRGEPVIAILGAADRDPARFPKPDLLDLDRQDNKHVAFGRGSHYCLGAPLARLETEIALATLLRRLPGLRLAGDANDVEWRPVPLFRSLVALQVAWG